MSFTEIAQRAFEIGKLELSLSLLEQEPIPEKKIPVYLIMKNYREALSVAVRSVKAELIFFVILHMIQKGANE